MRAAEPEGSQPLPEAGLNFCRKPSPFQTFNSSPSVDQNPRLALAGGLTKAPTRQRDYSWYSAKIRRQTRYSSTRQMMPPAMQVTVAATE
jgi:hypothetical protein